MTVSHGRRHVLYLIGVDHLSFCVWFNHAGESFGEITDNNYIFFIHSLNFHPSRQKINSSHFPNGFHACAHAFDEHERYIFTGVCLHNVPLDRTLHLLSARSPLHWECISRRDKRLPCETAITRCDSTSAQCLGGTLRVLFSCRCCDAGLSCCEEPEINVLNKLTKNNYCSWTW